MNSLLLIALIIHGGLFAAVMIYGAMRRMRMTAVYMLWMLALPVAGPLAGIAIANRAGRAPSDADWLSKQSEEHLRRLSIKPMNENPVPLEEALLVNDPVERRKQMMNLLHSDPMENLDLLMLARFNEDAETAHYATATITELQRKIQLELQHYQIEFRNHPEDMETLTDYIQLLNRYCTSGLLEGQALRRQRLTLSRALTEALAVRPTVELAELTVINHLALQQTDLALSNAQAALKLWPNDERSWMIQLRICVDMRDQKLLHETLKKMKAADINWTAAGRERLQFWTENSL